MANYVWPPALPQVPQRGFSESVGANIIRTPTDQGPAKQRRRSLRPSTMGVSFLMTTAQVAILQDFLYDTLQGVKAFDFTHPRTGYTVNTRVVPGQDGELFKSTYAAPGYWTITLNFEILPTFTTLSPGSYSIPVSRLSQFSRASTATYIEGGVLQTAPANTARYQGGQLLVEGEATNLLTYSQDFSNGAWFKSAASISANATSSPIAATCFKLVESATTAAHSVSRANVTPLVGDKRVVYVVAKSAERSRILVSGISSNSFFANFDLSAGTVGAKDASVSAGVVPLVDGWCLCWLSKTLTTANTGAPVLVSLMTGDGTNSSYAGDGASGVLLACAQFADGLNWSSYIPTTTAAATRAADLAIISAT